MRRTPLRRTTRLRPVSRKSDSAAARRAWQAVYDLVDIRSAGWCEAPGCRNRATDHHHTVKPRRSHHAAHLIVHLCRWHHEQVDRPYGKGRLIILPTTAGFKWNFDWIGLTVEERAK